mmetsp:Transcript_31624/g.80215  ORF Transcript_31624/g.80215 Transcript_31624/m.80215 type:complete len:209 (-) Transcript_31624:84-710(-)
MKAGIVQFHNVGHWRRRWHAWRGIRHGHLDGQLVWVGVAVQRACAHNGPAEDRDLNTVALHKLHLLVVATKLVADLAMPQSLQLVQEVPAAHLRQHLLQRIIGRRLHTALANLDGILPPLQCLQRRSLARVALGKTGSELHTSLGIHQRLLGCTAQLEVRCATVAQHEVLSRFLLQAFCVGLHSGCISAGLEVPVALLFQGGGVRHGA